MPKKLSEERLAEIRVLTDAPYDIQWPGWYLMCEAARALLQHVAALEAEIERLRDALQTRAIHESDCARVRLEQQDDGTMMEVMTTGPCTCGLDALCFGWGEADLVGQITDDQDS